MAFAMRFSIQFSNARPDTGDPYRAARARTIPDKYPEVKRLAKKLASFLPDKYPEVKRLAKKLASFLPDR
jgi:hypothetical protein